MPSANDPLGHRFPHSPLGSSLASVDLSSDEISATGSPQSFALLRMTFYNVEILHYVQDDVQSPKTTKKIAEAIFYLTTTKTFIILILHGRKKGRCGVSKSPFSERQNKRRKILLPSVF